MIKCISCAVLTLMFTPVAGTAKDFSVILTATNEDDFPTVPRKSKPITEQLDAQAQYNRGVMYDTGRSVPQDYAEAVKWYRRAAEQDYAQAQSNLGFMYANGQGVPQDHVEAVKWYRKAAGQGYVQAQYNLGVRYATSQGVSQNNASAYMWFTVAAINGDTDARENRHPIARQMTTEEIADAQTRARACITSDYQNCD